MMFKAMSVSSVPRTCKVSIATVNRISDTISFGRPKLPHAISIDEFRVNVDSQKYQCVLVDPVKHSVLDILSSKSQAQLATYFRLFPKASVIMLYTICVNQRIKTKEHAT